MSSPNGVVSPGARRLRVAYETITYTLETPDGETISLAGYVKGPGCPITVEIDVEDAWAEWSEEVPAAEEREKQTSHRYLQMQMRAERLLRRNLLCAVLPGLRQEAADVLAADGGAWEGILDELGWWSKTEQSTEGEAIAGDSSLPTGPDESPAGPPVTATTPSTPVPGSA